MNRAANTYSFPPPDDTDKKNRNNVHSVPIYVAIIFLVALCGVMVLAITLDRRLPNQIKIADEANYPDRFIGERSYQHLKQLTGFGPRVTGSYENEVLTVKFLLQEIDFIKQLAHVNQQIEVDVQLATGVYYLDFKPWGLTNNYKNVQNVVVKLKGLNTNSSLLINAHFDSVPTSPGGTDDGISCTTMLEVLRVLSRSSIVNNHNIVFLFNGAEENPLQAAHGFITQHKWAKEIRAVINMEGVGAGGREMVFQAGPDNPWLMQYYASVAPHPRAQVIAEELFQSNIIPSDTDFRLFRDFGRVPGVDMAFIRRGHVYHTKYDNMQNIENGSYQHIGDNVLALSKKLANAPELYNASDFSGGHVVFYDLFGFTIFIYTHNTGVVLNIIVALLGFFSCYQFWRSMTGVSGKIIRTQFISSFLAQVIGWTIGILICCIIAWFLDFVVNRAMSWYSNTWLVLALYSLPIIIGTSLSLFTLNTYNENQDIPIGLNLRVQLHIITMIFIWSIVLLVATYLKIRSAHLIMFTIVFPIVGMLFISYLKLKHHVHVWLYVYLAFAFLPMLFNMYNSLALIEFFIGIAGRSGADQHPDYGIGLLTGGATILILSLVLPLITIVRSADKFIAALTIVNILVVIAVCVTPLGFPYSVTEESQQPQRHWVFHTERTFHDYGGNVRYEDAGFFLLNYDRNSPQSLSKYVEEIESKGVSVSTFCDTELFCGMPISSARMSKVMKSTWVPTTPPIFDQQIVLRLTDQRLVQHNVRRLSFAVTGPDHIGLFVAPKLYTKLVNWSFTTIIPPSGPIWQDRETHYIHYGRGKESANDTWAFYFDIAVPEGWTQPVLDIAVAGQYKHHAKLMTPAYKNFIGKFPQWAQVLPYISNYKSYVY